MELLDTIEVTDGASSRRIELFLGNVLDLAPNESVDTLVVSAFPDDYTPTPGSLIGALDSAGVSLSSLAVWKQRDLRQVFSCWISHPIPDMERLGFSQVLCFEPLVRGSPPEVVDDIFRALNAALLESDDETTVAMPLVASGDQGWSLESMMQPLLEAAAHWLGLGLPIQRLKIVERSAEKARLLQESFAAFRAQRRQGVTADVLPLSEPTAKKHANAGGTAGDSYDVFVSYSHRNATDVETIVALLKEIRPGSRIFFDRLDLGVGVEWLSRIVDALDRSRRVVAVFSPDYFESKWCKDELNTAILLENRADEQVLLPIYLYSADVPTFYLAKAQHLDCREADPSKLVDAAREIAAHLPP